MADFYPYLIASLPMLHFRMKPPFSYGRFLELCRPFIAEKDFRVLGTLPQPEHYGEPGKRHRIIQKWIDFDTALRNELVRLRAQKKHVPPAAYLQPGGSGGPIPAPAGIAANLPASLVDAEKILDETRWKALDELATGHYFDQAALITYAYQLLILERWENVSRADGMFLLEQALQQ